MTITAAEARAASDMVQVDHAVRIIIEAQKRDPNLPNVAHMRPPLTDIGAHAARQQGFTVPSGGHWVSW